MSYSPDIADALKDADVEPVDFLESRNKYVTGLVRNGGELGFIKIVKPGQKAVTREDLFVETTWNEHFREPLAANGFKVPETIRYDKDFRWVLFEKMNGRTIKENDFPVVLRDVARLCVAISRVPIGREANGHKPWLLSRVGKMMPDVGDDTLQADVTEAIIAIADGTCDIGEIRSTPIHGDLKPDNLMINDDVVFINDSLIVFDAEFGTVPEDHVSNLRFHSELDKPMHFDAAFFYHLLYCQYHMGQAAEDFLALYKAELAEEPGFKDEAFEREFAAALLERTVSMGSHFVWRRNPQLDIADERRTEPGPYRALIHQCLDSLSM